MYSKKREFELGFFWSDNLHLFESGNLIFFVTSYFTKSITYTNSCLIHVWTCHFPFIFAIFVVLLVYHIMLLLLHLPFGKRKMFIQFRHLRHQLITTGGIPSFESLWSIDLNIEFQTYSSFKSNLDFFSKCLKHLSSFNNYHTDTINLLLLAYKFY